MHKRSPDEKIQNLPGLMLGDFWAWAYSDLLNNTQRGIFAEFLVGAALDVLDKPRIEWNGYDLIYREKRIEVKAAAYLQSWQQRELSKIRFDIERKQGWDAETDTYADAPGRSSDCFVFCLFTATDRNIADVLDLKSWEFYVLSTEDINDTLKGQKSIGLAPLSILCSSVSFSDLRATVDVVLFG